MAQAYPAAPRRSSPGVATVLLAALCVPAAAAGPVVSYTVTDAARIEQSLTGRPGDAQAGARLFGDAGRTGCTLCHDGGGAPGIAPGAIPADPAVLRLGLVAPEVRDPGLAFHAYYAAGQRTGAQDPLHGGPRLTAAEIEDLVAWLAAVAAGEAPPR